jgi:hypothetical protein
MSAKGIQLAKSTFCFFEVEVAFGYSGSEYMCVYWLLKNI